MKIMNCQFLYTTFLTNWIPNCSVSQMFSRSLCIQIFEISFTDELISDYSGNTHSTTSIIFYLDSIEKCQAEKKVETNLM